MRQGLLLFVIAWAGCTDDPGGPPVAAGPEPLANPSAGEWPTFRHDLGHSGVAPGVGAITAANHCIKWHPQLTCPETRGTSGPLIATIGELRTVFFVVDGPKIGCGGGTAGHVFALEGQTGSVGWDLALPGEAQGDPAAPTLADIDGDGKRELVFGSLTTPQVFAVRTENEGPGAGAGTIQWTFTYPERDARSEGTPVVANFDTRDATPEVVIATDYSRVGGAGAAKVFMIDGVTGLSKGAPFEVPSPKSLNAACDITANKVDGPGIAVADVGGVLRLYLGGMNGTFYALEWRKAPAPGLYKVWSDSLPSAAAACPLAAVRTGAAIGQLVPGGDPEVVFGYVADTSGADPLTSARLRVVSARGLGLVGELGVTAWRSTPAVVDLDPGTPGLELVGGRFRGLFAAQVGGGVVSSLWDKALGEGNGNRSSAAVADLDGDGDLEVAIGIEGTTAPGLAVVDALTGALAWEVPVTGGGVASSPAIGDLDGDGQLEVVFLGRDGVAYAIDSTCGSL